MGPSSKPLMTQKAAISPSSAAANKGVSGPAAGKSSQQVRLVHNPVILPKATTATVFVQKPTRPTEDHAKDNRQPDDHAKAGQQTCASSKTCKWQWSKARPRSSSASED